MGNHSRYMLVLLTAMGLAVVTGYWQVVDLAFANDQTKREPIKQEPVKQNTGQSSWGQAAQIEAEAHRKSLLRQLGNAQSQLGQPTQALDPSTPFGSKKDREALLMQIDEAQQRLADADVRLKGSAQAELLDLAKKLLIQIRAQVVGDPSVEVSPAQAREQITASMDSAQRRLDELRAVVAKSPNADSRLEQLERSQQQLDDARTKFLTAAPSAGSRPRSDTLIAQIYEQAQQRLDQARAQAATLPNSKELLEKIDVAQERLDKARSTSGVQAVPPKN